MAVTTSDNGTAMDRMIEAAGRVDEKKCRPAYGKEFGWFFSGHNDIKERLASTDGKMTIHFLCPPSQAYFFGYFQGKLWAVHSII